MLRSLSLGFFKRSASSGSGASGGSGNSAPSSTHTSNSASRASASRASTATTTTSTTTSTKSSLDSSSASSGASARTNADGKGNGKTRQSKRHSLASVKHEFASIVSRRPLGRHPSLGHSLSRLTSSQSCPAAGKTSDDNGDGDDVLVNTASTNNNNSSSGSASGSKGSSGSKGKSLRGGCSGCSDASPKTITRADITTGAYQPRVKKSRRVPCQEACPLSGRKLPSSSSFSLPRSKLMPARRAAAKSSAPSSGPTATSGTDLQPDHTVRPYYNDDSNSNSNSSNRRTTSVYQDYSLQRLNSSHSAYTVATADPARVNFRVVVDTDIGIGVVH